MARQRPKHLPLTNDLVFRRYLTANKQSSLLLMNSYLPFLKHASDVAVLNPDRVGMPDDLAEVLKQQQQSSDTLILKDTSIPPDKPRGRSVILDLNFKLSSGENVNIEMQTAYEKSFTFRTLYYWAMLYGQDIDRGDEFSNLNPTYSLIFTDFTLFKRKRNCISVFEFVDRKELEYRANIPMTLVTVELNKFKKSYHELIDMAEKWCYIIKHSAHLTAEAVAYLSQDGGMKMALEHLEEISKDDQLHWDAMARKKDRVAIQLAKSDALEEGIRKGMKAGRIQGMQEGRVQGMQEQQRGIALSMLQKGLDVSLISEVTGLSVAEIGQLTKIR